MPSESVICTASFHRSLEIEVYYPDNPDLYPLFPVFYPGAAPDESGNISAESGQEVLAIFIHALPVSVDTGIPVTVEDRMPRETEP